MIITSTGVGIFTNTTIGTLSEGSYIEVDNMSLDINDVIEEKETEGTYLLVTYYTLTQQKI